MKQMHSVSYFINIMYRRVFYIISCLNMHNLNSDKQVLLKKQKCNLDARHYCLILAVQWTKNIGYSNLYNCHSYWYVNHGLLQCQFAILISNEIIYWSVFVIGNLINEVAFHWTTNLAKCIKIHYFNILFNLNVDYALSKCQQ